MRHFLRDDDISPAEQAEILALAAEIKAAPHAHQPLAGPRSVAVLFDKSSTRTRVSFGVGIAELGGYAMILDSKASQIGRGESVADTARVLGRMTDAVVWRTYHQADIVEMAAYAGVPVVNALTDEFHPCQILADLQTIIEHKGSAAGLTVAYVGDGACNTANSYVLGLTTAGMHVRVGAPTSHHPSASIVADAEKIAAVSGGSISILNDASAAVAGADVVITDTWVSMGQEAETEARLQLFGDFAITTDLMARAAPDAIAMHCLPAYRDLEIATEVIDGPQSVVWDQAENRLHAQKALLVWLLAQAEGSTP